MGNHTRKMRLPFSPNSATIARTQKLPFMRELLSTAFSAYRQQFRLIVLFALVVGLPSELLYSYVYYEGLEEDGDTLLIYKVLSIVASVVNLALAIIPTVGILYSLELSASGVRPTFRTALKGGFAYWPGMAWTYVILGIILVCGFVFLIVPAVIFYVRTAVAEQLVIREKISGMAVVERSFALTKGRFWPLFWWFSIVWTGTLLIAVPFLYVPHIPHCDWWLPDAVSQTLFYIPLTFTTVFGWAVLNFLQEKERQSQPPPL